MGSLSIGQVARYRPLTECGPEELAAQTWVQPPSGGILFARKSTTPEKDAARRAVLDLFGPDRHPKGLSLLTMPGLEWKFERKLFGKREGNWMYRKGPHRTHVTCIENDRVIYHGALLKMPGLQQRGSLTQVLPGTPWAERVVRNRWVCRYYFGNVDDLMSMHSIEHKFDGAWLDYTGPLTVQRLRLIRSFFRASIRRTLVVTALRARWNRETSAAIDDAGGHSAWVRGAIDGVVEHDIDYQDGASPMSQLAFTHHAGVAA